MRRPFLYLFLTIVFSAISILFFFPFAFCLETLTISTYYPAAAGVYMRLTTQTLGVGDTNADGSINGDDSPDPSIATQQGDLWVAGRIGVGTTSPLTNLEVNNTLRLTPATTPLYTEEGAMYYNDNENVFKYYDGSVWKKMGGVTFGATQTVNKSITRNASLTYSHDEVAGWESPADTNGKSGGTGSTYVGAYPKCSDGYVATGMKLITGAECDSSCNDPGKHNIKRYKTLSLICKKLD